MPKLENGATEPTTVTKPTRKTTRSKQTDLASRPVLYPEPFVVPCLAGSDSGPLTAEHGDKLLGLITEEQYVAERTAGLSETDREKAVVSFGDDYLFLDAEGKKVRCLNNLKNRDFREHWGEELAQEILNKRWADSRNGGSASFVYGGPDPWTSPVDGKTYQPGDTIAISEATTNGEVIIIGRTGMVLSAQHRLLGLHLADQMRRGIGKYDGQRKHWDAIWGDQDVSIEAFVVFGVSESHLVTRTIDYVLPRTLADVVTTDDRFFGKDTKNKPYMRKDRSALSKIMSAAVKFVWDRSGMKQDRFNLYNKYQTHSESMAFVDRHGGPKGKFIETIRLVYDLERDTFGGVSKFIPLGTAAGLLYMMGASATDGDAYRLKRDQAGARHITWDNWERAKAFWGQLAGAFQYRARRAEDKNTNKPDKAMERLDALYDFARPSVKEDEVGGLIFSTGDEGGKRHERIAALITGWLAYVQADDGRVSKKDMEPLFKAYELVADKEADGRDVSYYRLLVAPAIGGIDLGEVEEKAKKTGGNIEDDGGDDPEDDSDLDPDDPDQLAERAERERIRTAEAEARKEAERRTKHEAEKRQRRIDAADKMKAAREAKGRAAGKGKTPPADAEEPAEDAVGDEEGAEPEPATNGEEAAPAPVITKYVEAQFRQAWNKMADAGTVIDDNAYEPLLYAWVEAGGPVDIEAFILGHVEPSPAE